MGTSALPFASSVTVCCSTCTTVPASKGSTSNPFPWRPVVSRSPSARSLRTCAPGGPLSRNVWVAASTVAGDDGTPTSAAPGAARTPARAIAVDPPSSPAIGNNGAVRTA